MTAAAVVLVTGGAGFIGSHVCEALVACGARVRVLDDFSTGRASNLARLEGRVEVVEGSIESSADVTRALAGASSVVHLAARSSVAESLTSDALYRRVNVEGTARLLDVARGARVARIVFAASSSAYGDHPAPHEESMEPRPMSPYAATKVEGERLIRALAADPSAPDAIALRFFNAYGARQDPGSAYAAVIPRFLVRAAEGRPLTIYGDGEQVRDFLHVGDAARAVVAALAMPGRLGGTVVNVGTGRATTIRRLAELICGTVGTPVALDFQRAREGEVRHSVAAIDLARRMLGFQPQVELRDGLARLWAESAPHASDGAGYVPGTTR